LEDTGSLFVLDFDGAEIKIMRHAIGGHDVYRIAFPDKRKPLVITYAVDARSKDFWTSVPQGRQAEAEAIGKLIQNLKE